MIKSDEKSEVLPDGRMVHQANLRATEEGSGYFWKCVCVPEDAHDHQKAQEAICERIAARDLRLPPLQALVGWKREYENVWAAITDCNIQPHGPQKWDLYVRWLVESKNHINKPVPHEYRLPMAHPKDCPTPREILGVVLASYVKAAKRHKAAQAILAAAL